MRHHRVECPVCGKSVAIKADGTLYRHLEYRPMNTRLIGAWSVVQCAGSGQVAANIE